jgi:hypothetical protein
VSLVELERYSTSIQAEIIRTVLESYGIEALVFDAGINRTEGGALPARLMVLDEDYDEAVEILSSAGPA